MPVTDARAKAQALYDARRTRTPIPPFTDEDSSLGMADGYAVQREPGSLVMTGALHAAVPMAPGDVLRAEFDRLGPVTVRVAAGGTGSSGAESSAGGVA